MSCEDSLPQILTYVTFLQLIRDEIKSGKSDKEIYKKLEDDFGETVLYAPKFDLQTAAIWLSPVSYDLNMLF
jgi:cytochrome c-type biogenesis protein CcmH